MARRNILRRQLAPHFFHYFALILSLFRGGKTNIIVILRQNSETAQISHHTQQIHVFITPQTKMLEAYWIDHGHMTP